MLVARYSTFPTAASFSPKSYDVFTSIDVAGHENAALWCGETDNDGFPECIVGSKGGNAFAYDTDLPDPTAAPSSTPAPTIPPTKKPIPSPTPVPSPVPTKDAQRAGGGDPDKGDSTGLIVGLVFAVLGVVAIGAIFRYYKQNQAKKQARRQSYRASHGGHHGGGNIPAAVLELQDPGLKKASEGLNFPPPPAPTMAAPAAAPPPMPPAAVASTGFGSSTAAKPNQVVLPSEDTGSPAASPPAAVGVASMSWSAADATEAIVAAPASSADQEAAATGNSV